MKQTKFKAVEDDRMTESYCAILDDDGDVVYAGRIKDAPTPPADAVMILHPIDFKLLASWFNRPDKLN